ncbi:MAG: 50S ribosomal protein L30 [Solirubrobacteraceae bacterium]|nr:50S ribosomal protein L30 [Solirubrobacteraceae bacterium]
MSALKVTQTKSKNGANHAQRESLRTLGLRKIGQTVEVNDTPAARGVLHRVRHLVKVSDES